MKSTYYSVPRRGWSRRNWAIAAALLRTFVLCTLGIIGVAIVLVGAMLLLAGPQ